MAGGGALQQVASGLTVPPGSSTASYWDFDISAGTVYSWQVTAVINGVEGLASNWPATLLISP
jgi:hypothetical protein